MSEDDEDTYVSDINELFHYSCTFLRILACEDRLRNPVCNLCVRGQKRDV